eukprot:2343038-Prymnesium_polylepis.1
MPRPRAVLNDSYLRGATRRECARVCASVRECARVCARRGSERVVVLRGATEARRAWRRMWRRAWQRARGV